MTVVDKRVRQDHDPDLKTRIEKTCFGQKLEDMAAEPPNRTLFYRNQHLVLAREGADEPAVQRLHVSRIGDRGRHSEACELLRRLQGFGQARAKRENGD